MNRFERDFPPPGIRYYGEDSYEEPNKPPFSVQQPRSMRSQTHLERYLIREKARNRVSILGLTGRKGIDPQKRQADLMSTH